MLVIPFRRSAVAALSEAIRTYIDSKYGQHPEMFRADLEAIDKLRGDAVTVQEPHPSGLVKLTKYAAQLVWLGAKFPIDVSGRLCQHLDKGMGLTTDCFKNNIKNRLAQTSCGGPL